MVVVHVSPLFLKLFCLIVIIMFYIVSYQKIKSVYYLLDLTLTI